MNVKRIIIGSTRPGKIDTWNGDTGSEKTQLPCTYKEEEIVGGCRERKGKEGQTLTFTKFHLALKCVLGFLQLL